MEAGTKVGKAVHSETLMKRDSEVCWSRMSLSPLQDLTDAVRDGRLLNTVVGPLLNYSLIPFPSS